MLFNKLFYGYIIGPILNNKIAVRLFTVGEILNGEKSANVEAYSSFKGENKDKKLIV